MWTRGSPRRFPNRGSLRRPGQLSPRRSVREPPNQLALADLSDTTRQPTVARTRLHCTPYLSDKYKRERSCQCSYQGGKRRDGNIPPTEGPDALTTRASPSVSWMRRPEQFTLSLLPSSKPSRYGRQEEEGLFRRPGRPNDSFQHRCVQTAMMVAGGVKGRGSPWKISFFFATKSKNLG